MVVNSANVASISANSASNAFTSVDNFCMAAILSSAFSLLRFAWAISADTVFRSAFKFSTLTKSSRRLLSNSFILSSVTASTPRVASFCAIVSKSVRMRLISNIRPPRE